jgi:hypothetical protein
MLDKSFVVEAKGIFPVWFKEEAEARAYAEHMSKYTFHVDVYDCSKSNVGHHVARYARGVEVT